MTLKSNAKFGEELTRHSKLAWGIWWILTRALENLTNSHFSGLLLNKVYIAWAIKSTEELSFKTLKSDAKFGEKLTCYFKIDIKNLTNFDPRIQKSKSLLLTGSFSRNYIFFEPRKVQRNYLSWHWRVMQNLERNWPVISKLPWRIWQILTQALKSLKNFQLNRLLVWAKYKKVWREKVQRSYLSWHWRVVQNAEGNWLVVSNLTWGIWQFLTRALKSLQNFYFNGLFLRKVYVVWAK